MNEEQHADISNWRKSPFSHWAFRNVKEIVPSAEIPNTPADPWPLPCAHRSLDGFNLGMGAAPSLDLPGFLAATATDGMVVLQDGRIVYEFYDHEDGQSARHIVMSASKSIVGLVVGILAQRDLIDVDRSISTYIPEIASTAYRGATVRHLLDMRTGVVLDERQQRRYAQASHWDPPDPDAAPIDLHAFLSELNPVSLPHGGAFRYVSANTDLLGWVIERCSGQPFAELAGKLLWRPMGADQPAYITLDSRGAPRCTGGICATARDLARIGQLMLQDGRRDAADIIPGAWLTDIVENGDAQAWKDGEFAAGFGGLTMSYRSGWYVVHGEPGLLFAMGIHGQNLFIDRRNRLVIAKLSSQNDAIDFKATSLTHRAVAELRRCLT